MARRSLKEYSRCAAPYPPRKHPYLAAADATVMACELYGQRFGPHIAHAGCRLGSRLCGGIGYCYSHQDGRSTDQFRFAGRSGQEFSLAFRLHLKRPDIRSVILLDQTDRRGIVGAPSAPAHTAYCPAEQDCRPYPSAFTA